MKYNNTKTTVKTTVKTVVKTVEETVEKILSIIQDNPKVSVKQLEKELDLTRRGIEWSISKLKNEGKLKRIGPDKGGHWEII